MTSVKKQCPEPRQLQRFVLGQLSIQEIADCQNHLSMCEPCVDTIASLKVDDTFTGIARQAFRDDIHASSEEQSAVDDMIRQASGWARNRDDKEMQEPSASNMNRSAEVHRLLREPSEPDDIGAIAHYRIVHLLGTGSTGVVYLALDTKLDRQVVLKILRPSLGDAARKRFVTEGRATAKLDHKNIVTIYEVGSDGPLSYLAMQWLPGQTLDAKLQEQESLSVAATKELVQQIASGLDAAHSQDLIHRDIKPANIWIPAGDVEARILDFGLVRIADEDPQLTCTGMIAGTPCFMSPEQSRGDSIDQRSDLFSLGCLMYQCLTGRLPFRSDNALATLRSIQQDQPTQPRELDPAIDCDTSDLVMCLLEKSPNRRPLDAHAVVKALGSDSGQWDFEYQPPVETKPNRKLTGFGFWKALAALIFGIALGALGLAYGQQIIRVVTDHGEIVIDTKVDDVTIEVVDNGKVISVIDLATQQSVEIKSGQYEIRQVGNENSISIDKNELTLLRGETEIVKISRKASNQRLDMINVHDGPYRLRKGDVLGVFADGLIGAFDSQPPIHYPGDGKPPVIGFPIAIEHDGTIPIPILGDVQVANLTIGEARKKLIDACTKDARSDSEGPLLRDNARIMLNLIHRVDDSANTANYQPGNSLSQLNRNANSLRSGTAASGQAELPPIPKSSNFEPLGLPLPPDSSPFESPEKPAKSQGYQMEVTSVVDSTDETPFEKDDSSPFDFEFPGSDDANQAVEKINNRIAELEKAGASTFDLLQPKIELQVLKANQTGNADPKPYRQLVTLREQQLNFIDSELAKEPGIGFLPQATLKDMRKTIRNELGNARTSLFGFEKRHGIRPYTQSIYEDQIYEHWYQVAQRERQVVKLNNAILSMANLADPSQQDEMLETVLRTARRGPGVGSKGDENVFNETIRKVFAELDVESFTSVLVDELRLKDRDKPCFMLAYYQELFRKLDASPGKNKGLAKSVVEALRDYAASFGDVESAFRCLAQFEPNWQQWGLSELEASNDLMTLYLDRVLKSQKFDTRVPAPRHNEFVPVTYFDYRLIAKYLPETTGLRDLVVQDLKTIRELAEKDRNRNQSEQNTAHRMNHLMNVILLLPDNLQPKQLLVDCINDELKFDNDTRSTPHIRGNWGPEYVSVLAESLGLLRSDVQIRLNDVLQSDQGLKVRLIDGKAVFEVTD